MVVKPGHGMSTLFRVVVFLALTHPSWAREVNGTTRLFGVGNESGAQVTWNVPTARLNAQACWAAEDGPPPLSVTKACEIGGTWLRAKHPEVKEFQVRQITLQSYSHTQGKRGAIWYYHIDYDPVVGGNVLRGDSGVFTAVLLLDGYVVEPTSSK